MYLVRLRTNKNNMGNFDKGRNGGKSFGGKPSFGGRGGKPSFGGDRGGRPSFGGRDSRGGDRSTESFKAVCDNCHKSCEVPFRPTSGKPVYCNDCFSKNRDFDSRPSFNSRESAPYAKRDDRSDRRDSKPAFSSAPQGADNEGMKKQLEALNVKLETILRTLETMKNGGSASKAQVTSAPAEKSTPKAQVAPKKEVAKKAAPKAVTKKAAPKTAKKVVAKKKK